ncbi:MAG TPA: hypothetical protein VHE81_08010 [Lacipirellulaceae bacterium]|nr:hypothetical protein [Lacipirellulaceae bacterium]
MNGTLLAIVAALALVNSVVIWTWPLNPSSLAITAYYGFFVAQPILFAAWTALGSGSIFTRLPIAVACLALVSVSPGFVPSTFHTVQKLEFVIVALVELGMFAITTALFLLFRWIARFRLWSPSQNVQLPRRIRFSVKFILLLTTLLAVDLGMALQLQFQAERSPGSNPFGLPFYAEIVLTGSALLTVIILPTVAVPLFILHGGGSPWAIGSAVLFWIIEVATLAIFFFDKIKPPESVTRQLAAQFAAVVASSIVAIVLRRAGVRLVRARTTPLESQPPTPS